MKRKLLVALFLAVVMILSVALVACDNHKCESECSTCHKCKNADCKEAACKDKCECKPAAETLAQSITKGVFRMDAQSRYMLVKFYEDGTFYAYGLLTDVYRGKYVVHENYATAIKYVDCGDDGNVDDGETTILTATKAVEFFEEDGTTPSTQVVRKDEDMPKGSHLDNSMAANVIAYTDGWLHHIKIGAQTRSLRQNKDTAFTKDDEVAVLMHEFMIADNAANASLISGQWTQQRRKVSLFDKKFEEAITDDAISEGSVTVLGNVFTLKYEDNSTATVTVAANGETATFVKGEKTIELVKWNDGTVKPAPTGEAILTKELNNTAGDGSDAMSVAGNNMAGSVVFNDDGTVVIKVTAIGLEVTGKWVVDNHALVVTEIDDMTLTQSGLTLTLGGTISMRGQSAPISATITCTQTELGTLAQDSLPVVKEVLKKEMKNEAGDGSDAIVIAGVQKLGGSVTFMSDGTVVISVPTVGLNVTGKWVVSNHALTVTEIGDMTLTQSGLTLTLGGTASVGEKSAPISATITCTQAELQSLMA